MSILDFGHCQHLICDTHLHYVSDFHGNTYPFIGFFSEWRIHRPFSQGNEDKPWHGMGFHRLKQAMTSFLHVFQARVGEAKGWDHRHQLLQSFAASWGPLGDLLIWRHFARNVDEHSGDSPRYEASGRSTTWWFGDSESMSSKKTRTYHNSQKMQPWVKLLMGLMGH